MTAKQRENCQIPELHGFANPDTGYCIHYPLHMPSFCGSRTVSEMSNIPGHSAEGNDGLQAIQQKL